LESVEEHTGKDMEKEEEETIEKKKEKDRGEIVEEKVYTIPLGRAWISPSKKRAKSATRIIRSFIQKHMKTDAVAISNEVNERVWSRGIEKPPRKIRVRALRDREGKVTLYLIEGE
jgi:large subunit ribosomal protein L31e